MKRRLKTKQQLLDSGYIEKQGAFFKDDHVCISSYDVPSLGHEVDVIKPEGSPGDIIFILRVDTKEITHFSPNAFLPEEKYHRVFTHNPGESVTTDLTVKPKGIIPRIKALEEELANLKKELGI